MSVSTWKEGDRDVRVGVGATERHCTGETLGSQAVTGPLGLRSSFRTQTITID